MSVIEKIAIYFLSLVFIIAGGIKIFDPAGMLGAIEAFRVVSGPVAMAAAYIFPWLELLCGVALLVSITRPAAAFILFGLMVLFIVALIWAWVRHIKLSCGCFGGYNPGEVDDYRLLIGRDLGLAILAAYIFGASLRKQDS